jgi:protoheme IX farnesyltransferase
VLAHAVALGAISLVPLWFGMGAIYGIGAAAGGAWFVWTSWRLYASPTRGAAMRNFMASLYQLLLLVAGVLLEATFGHSAWLP